MAIDFRDVYASILKDWFQVPAEDIQKLFSHEIKYHALMGACTASLNEDPFALNKTIIFPNPATNQFQLRLQTQRENVRISILSMEGKELMVSHEATFDEQQHSLSIDIQALPVGNYVLQIQKQSGNESVTFQKVKEN
jgi:hypothetical protein